MFDKTLCFFWRKMVGERRRLHGSDATRTIHDACAQLRPKSSSQTELDTNSSGNVNQPTSCDRKSNVKTMSFGRVANMCKKNGSKHMCFSTDTGPGPSKTRTAASRPLRTTTPAHNTPPLFLALGPQVTRLRTKTHRCFQPRKGSELNSFETYVFFHRKWSWWSRRAGESAVTTTNQRAGA